MFRFFRYIGKPLLEEGIELEWDERSATMRRKKNGYVRVSLYGFLTGLASGTSVKSLLHSRKESGRLDSFQFKQLYGRDTIEVRDVSKKAAIVSFSYDKRRKEWVVTTIRPRRKQKKQKWRRGRRLILRPTLETTRAATHQEHLILTWLWNHYTKPPCP